MSTITPISWAIRNDNLTINENFNNLNTDKLESWDLKTINGESIVWSGDIVISWGSWDMTKVVYDTNNDGIVNEADVITNQWNLATKNTVGTTEIDNNAVTLWKIQTISTATILWRTTSWTWTVEQLTPTQARSILNVEDWAEVNNINDTNATDLTDWWDTTLHTHDWRYYTETETDTLLWGKVSWPASSTDNAIARFDSTTGKIIQNWVITESDIWDLWAVNSATFNTTPTGAWAVAKLIWNDTDGTLDLWLKGWNVTLQVWQEEVVRVVNKTWATLTEANYQAVKITGAQWQRPKVELAQWDNDLNSATTIWLVTETISDNQEGFITISWIVRNINTTWSLQSETWADGDILYLSPTTAGQITNIKPTAPNHTVIIWWCIYAHSTQGKIFVKVDNWYELEELHNVTSTNYTSPIDADSILTLDSINSLWKRLTLTNLKSFLKTYFDTLYAAIETLNQEYSKDVICRVRTTANITLSGTQTIDWVALSVWDYVLVANQTTASQNWVYVVSAWAWTRATEYSTTLDFDKKDILVLSGTANAKTWWLSATKNPTVWTTSIVFAQMPNGIGTGADQAAAGNHTHTSVALSAASSIWAAWSERYTSRTASASTATTDLFIRFSWSTASQSETLPTAAALSNNSWRVLKFLNQATVNWTLQLPASNTLDGGTAAGTYIMKPNTFKIIYAIAANTWVTLEEWYVWVETATVSWTQTITNKNIQKRIVTVTQSATPSYNVDNGDVFKITGLAQAITSMTSGMTGTPYEGQMIKFEITDNGTARAITWWPNFEASTVSPPTTTVISTRLDALYVWNSATSKYRCLAVA